MHQFIQKILPTVTLPVQPKRSLIWASLLLGTGVFLNADISAATDAPQGERSPSPTELSLCGETCSQSDYYIGYSRSNAVRLGENLSAAPVEHRIFLNLSNLALQSTLPYVDVRTVDLRDGNFVNSVHRIDHLNIGFVEKTELMQVYTPSTEASADAMIRLSWGDTLTITSPTLRPGTPVTILFERSMGGFGGPVTDYAHYHANSQTYINGEVVDDLSYSLAKAPGAGESDRMTGTGNATYTFNASVGDSFTVEALLEVMDGVDGHSAGEQVLNGGDSVLYQIRLAEEFLPSVCLSSASGQFNSGQCEL